MQRQSLIRETVGPLRRRDDFLTDRRDGREPGPKGRLMRHGGPRLTALEGDVDLWTLDIGHDHRAIGELDTGAVGIAAFFDDCPRRQSTAQRNRPHRVASMLDLMPLGLDPASFQDKKRLYSGHAIQSDLEREIVLTRPPHLHAAREATLKDLGGGIGRPGRVG